MAIYMRMGWPSKALQLTSAPLAITSPSSTARPGGEMLARFHEDAQEEHRESCDNPSAAVHESGTSFIDGRDAHRPSTATFWCVPLGKPAEAQEESKWPRIEHG
jgi:hypothetical protein